MEYIARTSTARCLQRELSSPADVVGHDFDRGGWRADERTLSVSKCDVSDRVCGRDVTRWRYFYQKSVGGSCHSGHLPRLSSAMTERCRARLTSIKFRAIARDASVALAY